MSTYNQVLNVVSTVPINSALGFSGELTKLSVIYHQ